MNKLKAEVTRAVVRHRILVLAGLGAVDHVALRTLSV